MKLPYFILPLVDASTTPCGAPYYGYIENGDGDRFYADGRVERNVRRYRCDRLTGKIAKDFADILREWFNENYPPPFNLRNWEKMCFLNRQWLSVPGPENIFICASHNFLDANVAMNEAMEKNGIHIFGKNGDEAITERVSLILDKAWTLAKRKYLS